MALPYDGLKIVMRGADKEGKDMTKQHDAARKLLPIIVDAAASHQFLTYQTATESIGRPKRHARMVAQVCDLLDAAAAFADVPLLALITVLQADLHINRKAWTGKDVEPRVFGNNVTHWWPTFY